MFDRSLGRPGTAGGDGVVVSAAIRAIGPFAEADWGREIERDSRFARRSDHINQTRGAVCYSIND